MHHSPVSPHALRWIALKLHGLHPQDQHWLLRQLPRPTQLTLRSLLRELCSLGFPASDEALDALHLPPLGAFGELPFEVETIQLIEHAPWALLEKILKAQSEKLCALILSAHAWTWSRRFWNQLESPQRLRLTQYIERISPAQHALVEVLLRTLAAQLKIAEVPE